MTNSLRKIIGVYIAVSFLGAVSLGKEDLPNWKASEKFLAQLSQQVQVSSYTLKVPQSYTLQEKDGPPGIKAYGWAGKPRDNGTRPSVMVNLAGPPSVDTGRYTLEQALTSFLSSIQKPRKEWKQTKFEDGLIDGIKFKRSYWEAIQPELGLRMSGFNYVAFDNGQLIQLSSQDFEPHAKETVALAEAAVLTFRKRSAPEQK